MKKKRVRRSRLENWFFAAVFFFVLLLILAGLDRTNFNDRAVLDQEKNKLLDSITAEALAGEGLAFVIQDQVDSERLAGFAKKSYQEVKSEVGMDKDFVILFTNGDETLLPIGNLTCIGSPNSRVAGVKCG